MRSKIINQIKYQKNAGTAFDRTGYNTVIAIAIGGSSSTAIKLVTCDTSDGEFEDVATAVTPGQSAVFYKDGVVLGGGIIGSDKSLKVAKKRFPDGIKEFKLDILEALFADETKTETELLNLSKEMKKAKEDGSISKYHDEIEFRFINLFYQNTLFSYMPGVKRTKPSFVRNLGREMKENFPDFQKNPYYLARVHEEERRFIAVQQKSTLAFILYYKFVYFVRRIKKWIKRS